MTTVTTTLEMTQLAVKCFNLPDARTDTPPAGWDQLGYDDSGWSFSANPAIVTSTTPPSNGSRTGSVWLSGSFDPSALPIGAEAVWPTGTKQGNFQGAALRWTIALPSKTPTGQARWLAGSPAFVQLNQSVTINGVLLSSNLPTSAPFPINPMVVGNNLVAILIKNIGGGFSMWPSLAAGDSMDVNAAWVTYQWVFTSELVPRSQGRVQIIGA